MEVLRFGYSIPFLSPPPLSPAPVLMPSYSPSSTRGVALREVTLGLIAKGAVELAPLPSLGFYSRLFVVWKTSGSWRPVIDLSHLNGFVDVSHFQMETIHSFIPVGSSGRLDGLHRLERSVPAGSGKSGFSSLSTLCVRGSHFPIQSSVLWPLHGSAGFLTGHGSYFRHSPLLGYPHEAVPRRLAVVLSGIPPPGSPDCPRALPRAGGCDQPGEIPPRTIPGGTVSQGRNQLPVFCGFTIARSHLQAAVNRRRISILRLTSREIMALATGHAVVAGSPSSWRQTADAVSPVMSQSFLGSSRSLGSGILDRALSARSPVVAPPSSPLPRCVPLPSPTRPRLLVRHLRCRVGSSSGSTGRFRPLDLSTSISVHQRQGIAGHPTRSPPLSVVSTRSYGGSLLRQRHGSSVYPRRGRNQVSYAQHLSPGDPEVGGVPRHSSGSTVHPRLQQRPGGRSISPSPAPSFRVVPQHDRLSIFVSSVTGPNRFICDLRKSSMFHLFLSLPGSSGGGHGRLPPVLGRSAGLRLPSICHHSQSPREAPGISGDGAHPSGSALGSAPLVCRSPPAVAGLAPPVILPDRIDLLLLPRSWLRYPDLHRLRLHAWRLSGGSPELQDSPQQ